MVLLDHLETTIQEGQNSFSSIGGLRPSFERVKALFRVLIEHDIFKFSMLRKYELVHVCVEIAIVIKLI